MPLPHFHCSVQYERDQTYSVEAVPALPGTVEGVHLNRDLVLTAPKRALSGANALVDALDLVAARNRPMCCLLQIGSLLCRPFRSTSCRCHCIRRNGRYFRKYLSIPNVRMLQRSQERPGRLNLVDGYWFLIAQCGAAAVTITKPDMLIPWPGCRSLQPVVLELGKQWRRTT